MSIITSWSSVEKALEVLRPNAARHAVAWRTAWYIWSVHKQGIMCIADNKKIEIVAFSNSKYDNRVAWPVSGAVPTAAAASALLFKLDNTFLNFTDYYSNKYLKYSIKEGLGIINDPTAWWLNGHLLCNTANPWSSRHLDLIKKSLDHIGPVTCRLTEPVAFFINRRDAPQLMSDPTVTAHYMALGPLAEMPMFYGIKKRAPVFSYYGSSRHSDILWPPSEHWHLPKVWPCWPKKECAVFRGSLTGRYTDDRNIRLQLVRLAKISGARILDAGLTAWTPRCRLEPTKDGPCVTYNGKPSDVTLVAPLTMEQQARYAIIVYAPGHCASMRLAWHFLSGSCVIKLEDPTCECPNQWFDILQTEDHMFVDQKHYASATIETLESVIAGLLVKDASGQSRAQILGLEAQKVAQKVFDHDFMRAYMRQTFMKAI